MLARTVFVCKHSFMQIKRHFDEAWFLSCLNGMYAIRPGRKSPAPAREYELASQTFTQSLRLLIDEWLDSGRDENGVEEPHNRRPGRHGLEALIYFDQKVPVASSRIENGERMIYLPAERRTNRANGAENPVYDAKRDALLMFSEFMDRPELKARLAKCRRCGIYYLNKRKLAARYEAGTFCAACRSKVSAARSESDRRKERKGLLDVLFAEAWKRSESKRFDVHPSIWIADEVNKELRQRGEDPIKRNSVTIFIKAALKKAAEEASGIGNQ